jgi:hypothetical protein
VSKKDKVMVITKMILNLMNKVAARVHRPLKVIAITANGIWRQHYEQTASELAYRLDTIGF